MYQPMNEILEAFMSHAGIGKSALETLLKQRRLAVVDVSTSNYARCNNLKVPVDVSSSETTYLFPTNSLSPAPLGAWVKPPRTDEPVPLEVVISGDQYLPSNTGATVCLDGKDVFGFIVVASRQVSTEQGRKRYDYAIRAEQLLRP